MAELSATPALPSTADTVPYVPVSWMAVAASAVAFFFVAVLLALGISAFLAKKPLVQPELLALPAIGIVVSFAARRVIRNSEGTRTGERLAVSAWWICVIAGLGYAAYLLAIDYSVRRDARGELDRWIGNIVAEDQRSFNQAFLRTREPGRRAGISPDNTGEIKGLFPDEFIAFDQSDLVRLTRRNRGECEFVPGGVKEWMHRPGGVDCVYTGVMKCPEGTFPLVVPMRASEGSAATEAAGRQWAVALIPTGYIARDLRLLTRYGWLVEALEGSATVTGNQFIGIVGGGPLAVPLAYHSMIGPESKISHWQSIYQSTPARVAVAGNLALMVPFTPDYTKYFSQRFYKGPKGVEPTAEQREDFRKSWETVGIFPTGGRLRNSPDTQSTITLTDAAVEVRIPCELPFSGSDGNLAAARARLVLTCTDPAILAELKQLRSEADPKKGTNAVPEDLRRREFKWHVDRIESDMVPVRMMQLRPDGGPPGGAPQPIPLSGSGGKH